jgi:CDP-6-deoxy-D-xylo-4-hexulose-3-dehydrase
MIPLMKNAFLNEHATKQALADFIIKTQKFSMGEECHKFERKFSNFQKRSESILFNSGGSANLALLQALKNLGKLKSGDYVGFSALTWSTNIMPIIQMDLIPVPVDCSVHNLNVGSEQLLKTLETYGIKALFITNVLGFVSDIEKVRDVCNDKGIILLEDNCESLGTVTNQGNMTGNFGLASTFSFFVAHHMSTIEGGMICTDDEELSEMLKIVRANGWDRNLNALQQAKWRKKYNIESEFQAKYSFYDLGFNFRPTEITGFLGSFQLDFLEDNIKAREKNYKLINKYISENDDLLALDFSYLRTVSTFAIPIVCKSLELRNHYLNQFSGAGIEIRPMIAGNIQRQPFYSKYVKNMVKLPNTDFIDRNGFYCGNYPELTTDDLQVIISAILK